MKKTCFVLMTLFLAAIAYAAPTNTGYFFANVLGNDLRTATHSDIFDHIKDTCAGDNCSHGGLWGQVSGYNAKIGGDKNSVRGYKENFYGFSAGYDWYDIDAERVFGGFIKYMQGDARQEGGVYRNEADKTSLQIGAYVGFDNGTWDFNAVLAAGYNKYSMKRDFCIPGSLFCLAPVPLKAPRADFNAFTLSLGVDGGYKIHASDSVALRPYIGGMINALYHGSSSNNVYEILNVDGGLMAAAALKAGADVLVDTGGIFSFFGGAELSKYVLGATPEISGKNGVVSFTSKGATVDNMLIGLTFGTEARITDQLGVFGGINTLISSKYKEVGWKLGLRYAFCETRIKPPKPPKQPKPKKPAVSQAQPTVAQTYAPAASTIEIGSLYYSAGGSGLGPVMKNHLDQTAANLKASGFNRIYIAGFAENNEPDPHTLAAARARTAADYLATQGIPSSKMMVRGTVVVAQKGANWKRVDFTVE